MSEQGKRSDSRAHAGGVDMTMRRFLIHSGRGGPLLMKLGVRGSEGPGAHE